MKTGIRNHAHFPQETSRVVVDWPSPDVRCSPKLFCHCPDRHWRESKRKGSWVEIEDGESLVTSYCHGQNRLNLGKLIHYQSNQESPLKCCNLSFFAFSDMLRMLQSVTQMTKVLSAFDLIKESATICFSDQVACIAWAVPSDKHVWCLLWS